jgi:uncharacterized membrane protein YesL
MNQRVLVNIGQIIILNFVYILVNVLGLGLLIIPSTSTLFHFITKIRNGSYDPFDTFKPFIRLLVKNTKEMISIQIIFTIVIGFSVFNLVNLDLLNYPIFIKQTLMVLYTISIIESMLLIIVISLLNGNFIFKSRLDMVKMSFYLIHRHLLTSFIITLLLIVVSYVLFAYSLFIIFGLFALLFYLIDVMYQPIYRRHIIKEE